MHDGGGEETRENDTLQMNTTQEAQENTESTSYDTTLFSISDDYFTKSRKKSSRSPSPPKSYSLEQFNRKETMFKLAVFAFCLSSGISFLATIIDVYSRQPLIVPARQPQPFISNDSTEFIQDFYTGNANAAKFLSHADLIISLYYSPWSTGSREFRHKFEVVARTFRSWTKSVKFIAINCWAVEGQCRRHYKLYTYPLVVGHMRAAGVSQTVYTGALEIDHFYSWVLQLRYPYRYLRSVEELQAWQNDNLFVAVGYFPMENGILHKGFDRFLSAVFKLKNADPNFDTSIFAVITSSKLAASIGIQLPGDVFIYSGIGYISRVSMLAPGMNSEDVANWIDDNRRKYIVRSKPQWIYHDETNTVSTTRLADYLNQSAALILVTRYAPIYENQDDMVIFEKISNEYANCESDSVLSLEREEIGEKPLDARLWEDKQACELVRKGHIKVLNCCRSIYENVDWNIACASSTKYYWTDEQAETREYETAKQETEEEEHAEDDSEKPRRRNHWTDAYIPQTECCAILQPVSANSLLEKCCANYDNLRPPLSKAHSKLEMEQLLESEQKLAQRCLRSKLHSYMRYGIEWSTVTAYEPAQTVEQSIEGISCQTNNSLRFLALDASQFSNVVNRWGLSKMKLPFLVAIDAKWELFTVMEKPFKGENIRQFMKDFHEGILADRKLCETQFITQFSVPKSSPNAEIQRLNETGFRELIHQQSLTHESVVLFSGGRAHSPTMTIMHVYQFVARYFSKIDNNLIKFYIIDTSLNSLPYNFDLELLPAVVIFANSPDSSWLFPQTLPLTAPNLISFIVSQSSLSTRMRLLIKQCKSEDCILRNRHHLHAIKRRLKLGLRRAQKVFGFAARRHVNRLIIQLRACRRVERIMHDMMQSRIRQTS